MQEKNIKKNIIRGELNKKEYKIGCLGSENIAAVICKIYLDFDFYKITSQSLFYNQIFLITLYLYHLTNK